MTFPVRYRKPAILGELPARHAVIEASAGTGKTYTIEHLVVDLVLQGVPIAKILVVTFTEKAANELRVRARGLLEKLLDPAEDDRAAPETPASECWLLGARERLLLENALREYDAASISTIHAFCRQVLTENAFANGRLFDEELADGREQFTRAFRDLLRTRFAVEPELRELLALWREESSIENLEALLWSCVQRRGRIVPTYDADQAACVIRALPERSAALRLVALVNGRTRETTSAALGLLYDALEAFSREPGRGFGAYRALRGVRAAVPGIQDREALEYLIERFEKARGSEAASFHQALKNLDEAVPSPRAVVAGCFTPLLLARLAELKRKEGLFDFQDMLALVAQALSGPRGIELLATLRARFSHALIDEFQDTDEVQWDVFRRVFFESPEHRLFLIGDPKQAIYGFRGADVQTYLSARREGVGSGQPLYLAENYRSTKGLIDAYNRIFAEGFFTGAVNYDRPVACGRPDFAFDDPRGLAPIHVFVTDHRQAGKRIVLPRLAPAIAREIRRLVNPDAPARWRGRPLRYRDVFVLARSGSDLEAVAEHLREAGVPFAFYKQDGLFQSREAEAIEDVLAAVADPDDRAKRMRAWMTPFFGMGLRELVETGEVSADHPLMSRLLAWHRFALHREYEKLFTALLEDSGLVRRLILFEPGERSLTNYLHILEILREHYVVRGASVDEMARGLRAFRQEVRNPPGQEGNLQRLETERDSVQLLSMHMSKGLEAPVVFLVGGYHRANDRDGVRTLHGEGARCERLTLVGPGPERFARQAAVEEDEESQRLLYVALTRAKGKLYLVFAGTAPDGDGAFAPASLTGPYGRVNQRLAPILSALSGETISGELFSFETLRCGEPIGGSESTVPQPAPPIHAILAAPPQEDRAALRRKQAGLVTTSFTRLRDWVEGPASDVKSETVDMATPAEDELPGGAATGSFLHEILARVSPESAVASGTPQDFGARPEVARLVSMWGRRWGVSEEHYPHAHRLLHTALTCPLELGAGNRLQGIARAPRLMREMDFLFPLPEEGHPRLDEPWLAQGRARPKLEVRRGFVTGFVDVLFEHGGRTYFADWKSNCLQRFDPAHVADDVRRTYAMQGKLYTLALVKMLDIHDAATYDARFGGFLFLFLRGLVADGAGTEGVYFERPCWTEVLAWERELLGLDHLGGGRS